MDLSQLWAILVAVGEWADANKVFICTVLVPTGLLLWRQYVAYKRAKTIEEQDAAVDKTVEIVENLAPIVLDKIRKSVEVKDLARDDKLRVEDILDIAGQAVKDHFKEANLSAINRKVLAKKEEK